MFVSRVHWLSFLYSKVGRIVRGAALPSLARNLDVHICRALSYAIAFVLGLKHFCLNRM